MAKKLLRRTDTQEARDYWDHVDECALYVNAHHLCYSNMCIVNPGNPCDSPNTKDRKHRREIDELKMADIELELEKPCEGYFDYKTHEWVNCLQNGRCPTCKGMEYQPTDLGQQILDFVRKHG